MGKHSQHFKEKKKKRNFAAIKISTEPLTEFGQCPSFSFQKKPKQKVIFKALQKPQSSIKTNPSRDQACPNHIQLLFTDLSTKHSRITKMK